ncbi:12594_t:CDS:2 [Entrophospora sp. SA101]|nr:12594_t:CDS:2 [Entrophospora sp. SA101]
MKGPKSALMGKTSPPKKAVTITNTTAITKRLTGIANKININTTTTNNNVVNNILDNNLDDVDEGFYTLDEKTPKIDYLTRLPYEMASYILLYIDLQTLCRMSLVSRTWYRISRDNEIWRRKFLSNEGWKVNIPKEILISGGIDWKLLYKNRYTLSLKWKKGECEKKYLKGHIMKLNGHSAGVLDICFDDNYIVSCSKDCTIKVWNVITGELKRTLYGHFGPVNAIQLKDNRIISASGDALIKLWDLNTGVCIRDFVGHTRGLACVQFDGRWVVSGSNDKTIKIWDVETAQCVRTLEGHTDLVRTLHFDENMVISGSYDQTVKVWDLKTGKQLLDFHEGHTSWVFDVQFNRTKIVSTSQDKKILMMNFAEDLDTKYLL